MSRLHCFQSRFCKVVGCIGDFLQVISGDFIPMCWACSVSKCSNCREIIIKNYMILQGDVTSGDVYNWTCVNWWVSHINSSSQFGFPFWRSSRYRLKFLIQNVYWTFPSMIVLFHDDIVSFWHPRVRRFSVFINGEIVQLFAGSFQCKWPKDHWYHLQPVALGM